MAALYPAAGSAYTYVGRGINPHLGFLAADYSRHGIRVNAIVPGCMDTPMNAMMLSNDTLRQKRISTTPYGRLGRAEDVAGLAAYLASDEADYCVGGFYAVDGGTMAI